MIQAACCVIYVIVCLSWSPYRLSLTQCLIILISDQIATDSILPNTSNWRKRQSHGSTIIHQRQTGGWD